MTTIIAVKRDGVVVMGGDGQVTLGPSVLKHGAKKVRKIYNGSVLVGFAGSAADGLALMERLEGKLEEFRGNLLRASVELAKEWRTDRALRRLDAMLLCANLEHLLVISGTGDVMEPDEPIMAIGSGGDYARACALALYKHTNLSAEEIVKESLSIAAKICIYTNESFHLERLP
ncbi:peptidase [Thermocrinis ruber]|uniref:ATP-dependent protease subunit HslV n=1 Tax=Thermocrinis ruber TaxID=75906 RepID=W0DFY5_9AQUI|nr:ATP-dependent protease subunit HslV [Thermocrinis ruber]AHE96152.1 peptidase [Thermocrinis ruber]